MLRTLSRSRCLYRHARPTTAIRIHRGILTCAHDRGPSEPPLLEQTIGDHFASIVQQFGDRPAVISRHQQATLTYDALDAQSNALARGLAKIGVKKGDRVAVSLGNNLEFATATYALFKLGAILVPLNPAFNTQQVAAALSHLTASHLLIGAETNLPWKSPRSNIPLLTSLVPDLNSKRDTLESPTIPSLQRIIIVDNSLGRVNTSALTALTPYEDIVEEGGDGAKALGDQGLSNGEVVNIQFTSGTTSMPKAACLTHRSILNNGRAIGDRLGLTERDVVCCPPPLFHCFGSILGYMATATHGSSIVFPTESFNPLATLHAVRDYKCTALYGVPTMFVAELEILARANADTPASPPSSHLPPPSLSPSPASSSSPEQTAPLLPPFPPNYDFTPHLRTGIAAGSPVSAPLMSRLHSSLSLPCLTISYGMTETSPVSLMTAPDDALALRLETVGRLLPWVECKIVAASDCGDGRDFGTGNPTRERIVNVGERGELWVSGYLLMTGYWNDERRTSEVFVEEEEEGEEDETTPPSTSTSPPKKDKKKKKWIRTGDEAIMDENGYVTITGRIKDLIIRGGENIQPGEVERCLLEFPTAVDTDGKVRQTGGVSDVAVVGVPDQRLGEVVGAFVIVRRGVESGAESKGKGVDGGQGEGIEEEEEEEEEDGGVGGLKKEELREWVRGRLSPHLVPKYIFYITDFPKTASGKIQKFKLRELAVKLVEQGKGL